MADPAIQTRWRPVELFSEPTLSSCPQLAAAGSPSPRKLIVDSIRIALATPNVAETNTGANEFGTRSYFAGDDFLYTDYVFNWSTLYLSYDFRRRMAFDLYFSISPESHEQARNNTTTILLSTALTWKLI